ncbi:MAG: membrane integrity-associated transporter subunit PqiC [Betaproteobacteria bacterium]|nr:membrane integrity-associated transporter subunit PqiC [Betaproteobacteria bacterium]
MSTATACTQVKESRRGSPLPLVSRRGAMWLLLVTVVSACVNLGPGTPPRAPTYVLEPTVPAAQLASSGIAVGVGPVTVPGYLDRNEMVSREAANQLRVDTRHSWGSPLEQEVLRVLGEDLSRLLQSDRVVVWPWARQRDIAVRVPVQVLQFEPVAGKGIVLVARWELQSPDAAKVLFTRQSEIVEPVTTEGGPGAYAAGMSRALAVLAGQIADAVRTVPAPPRSDGAG